MITITFLIFISLLIIKSIYFIIINIQFVMKEQLLNMPLIATATAILLHFTIKYRENNLQEINSSVFDHQI